MSRWIPKSRRILRLIAAFKFLKAAALLAGGFAALRLMSPDRASSVQGWLERLVLEPGNVLLAAMAQRALALLERAGPNGPKHLAATAFLLALIYIVQGIGLFQARRWAEALTVVVTASFLPIEAVALWHRWTTLRAAMIVLNLAVVAYLLTQLFPRTPIVGDPLNSRE